MVFVYRLSSIEISKGKGSATSIIGKENKKVQEMGTVLAHVG